MADQLNQNEEETDLQTAEENPDFLSQHQVKVRWSLVNNDLGTYHNDFVDEFPNCLFVQVLGCGAKCMLQSVGSGGVALIHEEVMLAKAQRKVDAEGKVIIDRDASFLILEGDIIAFGKFGDFGFK